MLKYTTNTNKSTNKYQKPLTDAEWPERQRISVGGVPLGGGAPALSAGALLSNAHIRPFAEWNEGASTLKVSKGRTMEQHGGGLRKAITGFSRQSRLRLMYTIGAIRKDAELPDFVTLTYPNEYPTVQRAKRDLKIFLQRFARAWPGAGVIWKLEPQQRGAPHYHLLVWGCKTGELLLWVVRNWYDIAGNGDKNHLLFHMGALRGSVPCVQRVNSFRGVWSYASKYLGKTFETAQWGNTWTGRFWGVVQRKNIPFGKKITANLTYKKACVLMRYQRRHSGIKYRAFRDNTLTVFCDADQWAYRLVIDDPGGVLSPPDDNMGVTIVNMALG